MTYATSADLRLRMAPYFDKIYTESANALQIDVEALIDADLQGATAEVESALGFRYRLPVTSSQARPILKEWTLALAEERAWMRDHRDEYPKMLKPRVEEVRKYLAMIADGKYTLPGAVELATGAASAYIEHSENPEFKKDQMGRW